MKELINEYVGKIGSIKTENGLTIEVVVVDVKTSWGRTRYQVKPVAGSGECWVEEVKLKNDK